MTSKLESGEYRVWWGGCENGLRYFDNLLADHVFDNGTPTVRVRAVLGNHTGGHLSTGLTDCLQF